jgi:uncharacterized SAM-binding protein YcdF (DUF218 family)
VESGRLREGASSSIVKRRRYRRYLAALAALALTAGLLYLLRAQLLPPVARYLDVSEPPARTDYVMVLGGNAATRPFVAAALVRAGLAKSVLVPTVQPSPEEKTGLSPPEHVVIHRALLARGVSESAIIRLDGDVGSTSDEARRLADFLAAHPEGTVAIVTTGMHTRRARWIFERALGPQYSRIRFVAAPTDGFDETNWWRFERGWTDYATEYMKLATYRLRE